MKKLRSYNSNYQYELVQRDVKNSFPKEMTLTRTFLSFFKAH
ncbi:hypothetical protein NU08_4396 [Flavobacterium anhuiense]|uniref:Uncharacterized protein n=1 Tax=Flavobacterium anhuiense TaxID=459526 RepID=A0A444VSH0_9FLAO|nr:hypothetical protein NU08_4396 [Flavobacterium anhuiense]